MGGDEESDGHLERRMDISLELDPLKQHEREQRWKQGLVSILKEERTYMEAMRFLFPGT